MILKKYKPTTSSLRHRIGIDKKKLLSKNLKPTIIKKLAFGLINKAGRNHSGQITSYHRGGGNKKKYKIIDFKRLLELIGIVKRIEYSSTRSSFVALICYWTGILSYIIAPHKLKVGDPIITLREKKDQTLYNLKLKYGYSVLLKNIPIGSFLHNIEIKPLKGGQLLRAAGMYAILLKLYNNFAYIRLKTGEFRYIPINCIATLGQVSNIDHRFVKIGKAGANRWRNRRPTVRGVAMNPVDHPHGGRTSGGRPSVHFKGVLTKGKLTRHKTNKNKLIISNKTL